MQADPARPNGWWVLFGTTEQSYVDLDDPTRLEFEYVQIIASHLDAHAPAGERIRVVHLGGAGLTLPRYVAHTRPTSAQIVCEPDEELTQAVREQIPLPRTSGIKVRPTDGRSGVAAMREDFADVVVVDAFAGAQVPPSLASAEFFAELRRIIVPGGLLCMNVTDTAPFAWTRRVLSGLSIYFPHLAISAESATLKGRRFGNLVIAASTSSLPLDAIIRRASGAAFPYRVMRGDEVRSWMGGAQPFHDSDAVPSPPPPGGLLAFS